MVQSLQVCWQYILELLKMANSHGLKCIELLACRKLPFDDDQWPL